MCGITGLAVLNQGTPPAAELVARMNETLIHRGPDDAGLEVRGSVGLAMRRLSIIDVEGGHQPLYNEDGEVRLVFNGEIYNFRELRRELRGRGHQFRTGSDGEVIVHLWEELGPELLTRLNGMFALALHDRRQGKLFLARDHVGIKPLYVARTDSALLFGSEVKSILASGLVPRRLDLDALVEFLTWEYVPAPRTLFRDISKLRPGERLLLDLESGQEHRDTWWSLQGRIDGPSTDGEWHEAVSAKIDESVRRQLVSDVPLGAFLSGGVDSSLVVSAMEDAETFSIGFDDPTYNELAWSREAAQHLGTNHRTEVLSPDIQSMFDPLMAHMDDPIADFSIFPTFLVSELAREHVTVALSGDGGDEIFGGYETYLAQDMERAWNRVPRPLRKHILEPAILSLRPRPAKKGLVNKARRFVEGLQYDPRLGHARWRRFLGDVLREELLTEDAKSRMTHSPDTHVLELQAASAGRSEVDQALYVDMFSYLTDNCLVKVDRMSMATSLEVRVPLLDPELIQLAFCLPANLKVSGGESKVLLKRIAAERVPAECVYRPKEGFSIPIKHWLRSELRPMVDGLLSERRIREQGVFSWEAVRRLRDEHMEGRENHSHVLWALLVFHDWRARWHV